MDAKALRRRAIVALLLPAILLSSGCHFGRWQIRPPQSHSAGIALANPGVAIEKDMYIHPEYIIEPPDVLTVTAVRLLPKTPYSLQVGDTLIINVIGTLPDAPIRGEFPVQIGGTVNLGFAYGDVAVRGLSVEEAQELIDRHLRENFLRDPIVTVSLGRIAAEQQIAGPRLVAQDGRVNLGVYGTVSVAGLTINEAKQVIEKHLTEFLDDPEVAVDVQNYNSKFYYVITQGAGLGDRIARVPISGNETVLDAVSQLGALAQFSSTTIWIARPGRGRKGHDQILLVDWRAITQLGETDTNYQIFPNDRLYISEKLLVRLNNDLQTLFAPVFTVGQFINFMLGTIRNLNAGVAGQAPFQFQNLGPGGGGIPGGGGGGGIPGIPGVPGF